MWSFMPFCSNIISLEISSTLCSLELLIREILLLLLQFVNFFPYFSTLLAFLLPSGRSTLTSNLYPVNFCNISAFIILIANG